MRTIIMILMLVLTMVSALALPYEDVLVYDGIDPLYVSEVSFYDSCLLVSGGCVVYHAEYDLLPSMRITDNIAEGHVVVYYMGADSVDVTDHIDNLVMYPVERVDRSDVFIIKTPYKAHLMEFRALDSSDMQVEFLHQELGESISISTSDDNGTLILDGLQYPFTVDWINESVKFEHFGWQPDFVVELIEVLENDAMFKVNGEILDYLEEVETKRINSYSSIHLFETEADNARFMIYQDPGDSIHDILPEYTTKTYLLDNVMYEIEVIQISSALEVIFRVNGEITEMHIEGEEFALHDGTILVVENIYDYVGTENPTGDYVEFRLVAPRFYNEIWVDVEQHSDEVTNEHFISEVMRVYATPDWEVNEEVFEGEDNVYVFLREYDNEYIDAIVVWYSGDDVISLHIEGWMESHLDENVFENLLEEYIFKYPSDLVFDYDTCNTKKIFLGDALSSGGKIAVTYQSEGNIDKVIKLYKETHGPNYGSVAIQNCLIEKDICNTGSGFNCFLITSCDMPYEQENVTWDLRVEDRVCPDVYDMESITPLPAPAYYKEVLLTEGWNLISIGKGIEFTSDEDLEDSMRAVYLYSDGEFHDLLFDEEPLSDMIQERGYAAIWVYMDDEIVLQYEIDLDEIQETVEDLDFTFDSGWNFYVILPHMQEQYYGGHFEIFEDDGYSVVNSGLYYIWDNMRKNWLADEYRDLMHKDIVGQGLIGQPILMNYKQAWTPFWTPDLVSTIPIFPDLPEEPVPVPVPDQPEI